MARVAAVLRVFQGSAERVLSDSSLSLGYPHVRSLLTLKGACSHETMVADHCDLPLCNLHRYCVGPNRAALVARLGKSQRPIHPQPELDAPPAPSLRAGPIQL